MDDTDPQTVPITEAPGAPDPVAFDRPDADADGGFRLDVLLIALVVVGAVVAQNIWLRIRAERSDSD